MTSDDQTTYLEHLWSASPQTLELARTLQRAAFFGRRQYADGFIPAPVYLDQAVAIYTSPWLLGDVYRCLTDIATRGRNNADGQ